MSSNYNNSLKDRALEMLILSSMMLVAMGKKRRRGLSVAVT